MPNTISGNPANITTPLVRNVNGAVSAGGLIKISTSVAHLFSTNDLVTLVGVGGVPNANGTFYITVVDSTHFTLNSSTFAGAYTTGGTVTDYALTPAFNVIADGENITSASLGAAFQALADRTQYLATVGRALASQITVPPLPILNISRVATTHWILGDDGSGSSDGPLLVHDNTPTSDAAIIELTPYLVGHVNRKLVQCNPVFAVGQSHANPPGIYPSVRILRSQSLTTLGVGPAGFTSLVAAVDTFFPNPGGTGASYYNSGHLQNWPIVTDQNNVIDPTFRYFAAILDESGANSLGLNSYYGFQLFIV